MAAKTWVGSAVAAEAVDALSPAILTARELSKVTYRTGVFKM